MDQQELDSILEKHKRWLYSDDGARAYLAGANLAGADLADADLADANLADANLAGADLAGANLAGADLRCAYLAGTCLDKNLRQLQRAFVRQCPPLRTGGRIVYRTRRSQHVASIEYEPGRTYVAPHLSFSAETDCHPGIYAASLEWMRAHYMGVDLVRCYVRDGDWVISAKGAIRCKRLRVLDTV